MATGYCSRFECYQTRPCRTHDVQRVLVTGANKGIGFAIVEALLRDHPFHVLLGSRDKERGFAAVLKIIERIPSAADRVSCLPLDVSLEESVAEAVNSVRRAFPEEKTPLAGLICNAGVEGTQALDTNTKGVIRVCEQFLPLLRADGRVVVVSSAAGPIFVSGCSPERQKQFTNPEATAHDIDELLKECQTVKPEDLEAKGLGKPNTPEPYGMSKALANLYVIHLARRFPRMKINACSPGMIETDLVHRVLSDKSEEEKQRWARDWKQPSDGARSSVFLMTSNELAGNGHYYGSDSKRSPLDRYRAPGSPEYQGILDRCD